jgi:hydroxymethylbilane synthase
MGRLKIGSRGSPLALWQANHIAARLREQGHEVEIAIIKTTGDRVTNVGFAEVGTKGMFTKEIEEALEDGRVDLAVHSLKDLPTDLPEGFELAAVTRRECPNDVLLSSRYASLATLPQGARVGTGSLRRQAQLKALRPDVQVLPLRGNVDTRIRKLEKGEYDAIILAAAGLNRLGSTVMVREVIPAETMCPAAGQGALGIEIRAGDAIMRTTLVFLNDPETFTAISCERSLLERLGGGCQVPIGALAEVDGGRLSLQAVVARPDGTLVLRETRSGDDPLELSAAVAGMLRQRGADHILQEVYGVASEELRQP